MRQGKEDIGDSMQKMKEDFVTGWGNLGTSHFDKRWGMGANGREARRRRAFAGGWGGFVPRFAPMALCVTGVAEM
jgi:hypothetical protein